MSLSWPWALLALLVLPLVLATWWLARRRRRRAAVRVTSIGLIRAALPGRSRWRRRVPVALLAVGLAVLCVGAARPQATVPVASSSTTIMLALDEGILTSLDAIAQVDPSVAPTGATVRRSPGAGYADDVIVVLTDGSNNQGVDPQTAAKEAADRGVRVFTIG
jgi:hypothetical protein